MDEQQIDRFCEGLHERLTDIAIELRKVRISIETNPEHAENEVRLRLSQVFARILQGSARVLDARMEVRDLREDRTTTPVSKVAEWKASGDIGLLRRRLERADRYAAAVMELAVAALDEAEEAALLAWLAKRDLESLQN